MQIANTDDRYGVVAKTFHWLVALLILSNVALGLVAERLPMDGQAQIALKAQLFSIHKTVGVAVFFAALLRIAWSIVQPRPIAMHPERRAENLLAETVHWTLYAALVVVPLSGWIQHAASEGFAPILWPFGQALPMVPKSAGVEGAAQATHWVFTKVLIGAVILHVLGALKHALVDRDGTLARMWFGRPALSVPPGRHEGHGAALLLAATIYVAGGVGVVWLGADRPVRAASDPVAQGADGAGNWHVESGTVEIAISQFGSTVTGRFDEWRADITFDEAVADDGPAGQVRVEVTVPSLTLGSVTEQAMGADYFDAEAHPLSVFEADILRRDGRYVAEGTLDLAGQRSGITLPFTLEIEGDLARMEGGTLLDRRSFAIGEGTTDPDTLGFDVSLDVRLDARRAE